MIKKLLKFGLQLVLFIIFFTIFCEYSESKMSYILPSEL